MSKKTLKHVTAREEKESGSYDWIPIAAATVLFVGAIVWFVFFSGSSENESTITDPALVGNGQAKGNPNAKVTVVEFSDFQCPACGAAYPATQQVFEKYKEKILLVYRHFPLITLHPFAVTAAEASECAADQGQFWKMHDSLFEQQSSWSATQSLDQAKQNIRSLAQQIGLNMDSFDSCLSGRKNLSRVQEGMDAGARFGVNSTPTFFVNGKMLKGALSVQEFSREIDAALASAK